MNTINAQTPGPVAAVSPHPGQWALVPVNHGKAPECWTLAYVRDFQRNDAENARLFAASYNAFDKAGRELGIDAAELAERIDLVTLIRAVRHWRGNGFPSCGIDDIKIGPTPADPVVDALRFYANRENWKDIETGIGTYPGEAIDYGAKARAALGKLPA